MNAGTTSGQSGHLCRMDSFIVPEAARDEFLERVRQTHDLLKTLPGFVQDVVLERIARSDQFNFVTMVEWDSEASMENAKAAVAEMHAQMQFDPRQMLERLEITVDRASYLRADGRSGKAAGRAGDFCGKTCVSFLMMASAM